MSMKTVKVNDVYHAMLVDLAKKNRKNIETYLGDLISAAYGVKK